MGEPVALHHIVGGTANEDSENPYEIPQALIDERQYENLQINTDDEAKRVSRTVSDKNINHAGDIDNDSGSISKCCKHLSAVRQLQMLCAVLLTMQIISSITIGLLINKLVS